MRCRAARLPRSPPASDRSAPRRAQAPPPPPSPLRRPEPDPHRVSCARGSEDQAISSPSRGALFPTRSAPSRRDPPNCTFCERDAGEAGGPRKRPLLLYGTLMGVGEAPIQAPALPTESRRERTEGCALAQVLEGGQRAESGASLSGASCSQSPPPGAPALKSPAAAQPGSSSSTSPIPSSLSS